MSGDVTQIVGWSLIHFLWQGIVIALLLQGCLAACRTAAGRYRLLMGTLALMLAAPLVTAWVLAQPAASLPPLQTALTAAGLAPADASAAIPTAGPHFSVAWLVYGWLAGVTGLSLRWLGGFVWLERIRRDAAPLSDELALRCRTLMRHVGLSKPVRFAQSAFLAVPMVVGWLRPVVLIPVSTLTALSPQQLDTVILHELAHIRRLDAFANLFQILVETLLFYHPAVWWVSHRVRVERENCCDDIAVGIAGDNFGYAMALTMLEAERAFPTMAMAATGGALKNRVKRLLGQEKAPSRPFHLAAVAVALIGLVLGGGALKAMAAPHVPEPAAMAALPVPPAPPSPISAPAAPVTPAAPASSYIGDMADAGYANLSAGELIAMKSVGISPEEARAWRTSGFPLSPHEMVGLHASGIRPADIAGFRDVGMTVTAHDLPALRSVGVTPDYIRGMLAAGFEARRVSDFISARSVGVTPEFVATLKKSGVTDLTPGRIVTLKAANLN